MGREKVEIVQKRLRGWGARACGLCGLTSSVCSALTDAMIAPTERASVREYERYLQAERDFDFAYLTKQAGRPPRARPVPRAPQNQQKNARKCEMQIWT